MKIRTSQDALNSKYAMIDHVIKEGAFEEEGGDASDEEDISKLDIPVHAFDVVIADECHRGYTAAEMSKWREVLDYFDAAKIGLTATPAAHTTSYFGEPVFLVSRMA